MATRQFGLHSIVVSLSPIDPLLHQFLGGLAQAFNQAIRADEAIPVAERAVVEQPHHAPTQRALVAAYALAGRLDDGRQAMNTLLCFAPWTRLSRMSEWSGPIQRDYQARLAEAYRLAGMPEDGLVSTCTTALTLSSECAIEPR